MNRVAITGNLTRDPEIKKTSSGLAVCNGSVAVNEWRKDKEDYVSYFDFTVFGSRAEAFERNHAKGDKILIEGKLKQERWEDKNTGGNRSKIVVIVDQWEFVKAKQEQNF